MKQQNVNANQMLAAVRGAASDNGAARGMMAS